MRKELRPIHDNVACDVCGRTILKGERTEAYLAPGGHRHTVCELCFARAEEAGWIRESAHDQMPARGPRPEARRPFLGRLRRRRPEPVNDPSPAESSEVESEPSFDEPEQAPPEPEPPAPRAAPKDPRHVRAVPTTAEVKVERALDLFNRSDHQRTVAGLTRTLGTPWVSARPDADARSTVTILVAWELSWYRYRVDLGDAAEVVELQDKGDELGEIDEGLREWNSGVDREGRLVVGVASER
jgi:hypothetical protein